MPATTSPKPKAALAPLDDLAEAQTRVPAARSASAAAKRSSSRGEMATKAPTKQTKRPVPKGRRDWRPIFLEAYGRLGIISGACKVAKVGRTIVYMERARNPEFAEAWDEVEQQGIDEVELAARVNALAGNAPMQMFLLKTRRRELYGESGNEELRARLDRQQVELDAMRAGFAALDDADKLRVLDVARRELPA
jgi:hypothetical protein